MLHQPETKSCDANHIKYRGPQKCWSFFFTTNAYFPHCLKSEKFALNFSEYNMVIVWFTITQKILLYTEKDSPYIQYNILRSNTKQGFVYYGTLWLNLSCVFARQIVRGFRDAIVFAQCEVWGLQAREFTRCLYIQGFGSGWT